MEINTEQGTHREIPIQNAASHRENPVQNSASDGVGSFTIHNYDGSQRIIIITQAGVDAVSRDVVAALIPGLSISQRISLIIGAANNAIENVINASQNSDVSSRLRESAAPSKDKLH
jgi:hypothetical protein